MNDAKGHASNLLILSLATALVGAGILSWSLTQSSIFQERPRPASSLAIKNTVSESIMTNQPAQNPVKIKIPDVKTIQAHNPDSADESVETVSPDDIIAQEQAPEASAGETVLAEKIILPETTPLEEVAAAAPEAAETSEVVSTAEVTPPEAPTKDTADAEDAVSAIEVTPPETPIENIANTEDAETLASTETPEEINTDLTDAPDENTQITERQKNGWIYAGQYANGKWVKRGLELPDDKLPDTGNTYKLIWGTNVRLAPPGKRTNGGNNLAKNIDYLAENREIEITSIKNSGKTGHIWLEIKY